MIKDEFNYIAFGPSEGEARKLIVLFHGYGVNADFMEKMANRLLKDIPDARIICPDAPVPMALPDEDDRDDLVVPLPDEALNPPEGLSPDRQFSWFTISNSPQDIHNSALAVAEKINGFIDRQRDALGLKDKDIAFMGFSQGGATALYTAFTRHSDVACVAAHSALVLDTEDFTARPPVLLIYGDKDRTFSEQDYQARSIVPLENYLPDFTVKTISGLGHSTNARSRAAVSGYIAKKLNGPA